MVNSTHTLDAMFFDEIEQEIGHAPALRKGSEFQRSGQQRFNTERRYAKGNSGWSRGGAHLRSGKKRRA